MRLLIALSSDGGTSSNMRRPALACTALRAGLFFRKDDPKYEGTINELGNGFFIAHRDALNWHMLANVRDNLWHVKYAPADMLAYYKIQSRKVEDHHMSQIINHFFKEKPHAD